jgi:hypothetical protein
MSSKVVNRSYKPKDWVITVLGAVILGFSVGALLFPPIAIQNGLSSYVSPSLFYPVTLLIKGILIIIGLLMWYQIRTKAQLNRVFWIVAAVCLVAEFLLAIRYV